MKQNAILIDICGTLFYSNTTFDFLDYYIDKQGYRILRKLMNIKLCRYLNSFIYRTLRIDCFRKCALHNLKNISKDKLLEMADLFYTNYLEDRKNREAWEYIDSIADKESIALVSGTIDPIAITVANKMGINTFISSELEYKNNICTGKLQTDALRNKLNLLKDKEVYPPFKCIMTDNPGDIPLIKESNKSIIVLYDNLTRWENQTKDIPNITYINHDKTYEFKR